MIDLIKHNLKHIKTLCENHSVKTLSLFGSAAKNTMHEESDIDFLVEFDDDVALLDYADNYFSLLDNLEKIFNKNIELISAKSLKNPVFKDEVYKSKIDLYAA
jgi:predicted nucleotidyltransferase